MKDVLHRIMGAHAGRCFHSLERAAADYSESEQRLIRAAIDQTRKRVLDKGLNNGSLQMRAELKRLRKEIFKTAPSYGLLTPRWNIVLRKQRRALGKQRITLMLVVLALVVLALIAWVSSLVHSELPFESTVPVSRAIGGAPTVQPSPTNGLVSAQARSVREPLLAQSAATTVPTPVQKEGSMSLAALASAPQTWRVYLPLLGAEPPQEREAISIFRSNGPVAPIQAPPTASSDTHHLLTPTPTARVQQAAATATQARRDETGSSTAVSTAPARQGTLTPTTAPTLTQTPAPTETPTSSTSPTLTATQTVAPTDVPPISPTPPATETEVLPTTTQTATPTTAPTNSPTLPVYETEVPPTVPATATTTATSSPSPTATATASPTVVSCAPYAQAVVSETEVIRARAGRCGPDGRVAHIGKVITSELLLDMGVDNEIVDGPEGDLIFYESPRKTDDGGPEGIDLDAIQIELLQTLDSQPRVVFVWGDEDMTNNGELRDLLDTPSLTIPAERLRLGAGMVISTGVGIDIGGQDGTRYRYVRITRYTKPGERPERGQLAQVDAIERRSFALIEGGGRADQQTATPAPTSSATPVIAAPSPVPATPPAPTATATATPPPTPDAHGDGPRPPPKGDEPPPPER